MGCSNIDLAIALLLVTGISVISAAKKIAKEDKLACTRSRGSSEDDVQVIKSEHDKRNYKYIHLGNKLRLMLVSDPSIEKSAASVSINAGYSNDPDTLPGLAHFLEHMLFLGTSKYPDEGEFSNFLGQNGGSTNAYTSAEYTTYHFDVKSDALEAALDRFAQFFVSPLFDANSTDRELHAIDQEFQKNYLEDSLRIDFIERASSRPGHAYGHFGGGNIKTLRTIPQEENIDIRKKLLKFYNQYYSANIMSVAVLGKESLGDLEKMVVPRFENIENRHTQLLRHVFPYGKHELGVVLKIPTIREMNRMALKFQFPDSPCLYRSKPAQYLSQVIGHEGKGSLLSLLKKKGWAYALWAGDRTGLRGFEFFIIGIDLTKNGLSHVDDIISLIFQYIEMLKRAPLPSRIYHEMKVSDEVQFRFQDKEESKHYVQTIAENLHIYQPEHVLNGKFLTGDYLPEKIREQLMYFSPKKFRYLVASNEFKGPTNMRTKYYEASYRSEKIPEWKIRKWLKVGLNAAFHLPSPNPFLPDPKDLKIVVHETNSTVKHVPEIIKDNAISRVWHKADDTFYLPKSSVKIGIISPHSGLSPSDLNHLSVYVALLRDSMTEFGYAAQLAGIRYNIRWVFPGVLVINVDGYSSKQEKMLRKILQHVVSLRKHIKREKFKEAKQKMIEYLKNSKVEVPYRQTGSIRNYIMTDRAWNATERLHYIDELSVKSLRLFIHDYLRNIYIEALFCGNILHSTALSTFNIVERILITNHHSKPMLPVQHLRKKEYNIPPGSNYLCEKRSDIHSFSAVEVYLQVGLRTERNNVLCRLFLNMIYTRLFDTLRTKEQLGYIVYSGRSMTQSVVGIRIQVQSDSEPSHVEGRIDNFLEMFNETLAEMSRNPSQFKDFVEATAVRMLAKPKHLWSEVNAYSSEIFLRQYHFRRAEKEVELLRNLTTTDVIDFYNQYVHPASKQRKKLVVAVLGVNAVSLSGTNWTTIEDILSFKSSLPLYPHVMPYNNIPLISYNETKLNDEL